MHHKSVITRIPPSPTGHLHLGTARTALFNFLYARQNNGKVVFRSEDTDRARSTKEFEAEIVDGLHWLGLDWDNDIWRQSEQTALYTQSLQKLIDQDKAYESIEPSKNDPTVEVAVVRLRNPNIVITFTDIIRGDITFDTTELGDFVIARAIDDPLYHLTVVVDDAQMGVTHILRGEDHIANTPRQILIQEALDIPRPVYAHLPLILASDRSKLSKRNGAVAIRDYQQMGILPEALINYLALLGWNPGTEQEIFTLDELIEQFDITKVQKGGAVFDLEKLAWINSCYLKRRTEAEQVEYVLTALGTTHTLTAVTKERFIRLALTILERYQTQAAISAAAGAGEWEYLFSEPDPTPELLKWKKDTAPDAALPRLLHLIELIPDVDFSSPETIKSALFPYAEITGRGEVLWPFRVALSGQERSPDPFTLAFVLGREATVNRLSHACAILRR